MLASLYPVRDMRLSGQVIHTGKSSLEVAVRMEALGKDGNEQTIMLGDLSYFLLSCKIVSYTCLTLIRPVLHGLSRCEIASVVTGQPTDTRYS